ncbi:DUF2164 domain-containing protein [Vallitalea okinawensis]|uniref:DUF2164 domain-containing protein n=1 Tax=Vallitalea okinawensis TaxID=2078660 RepID=UPI000CFDEB25|nr:DUF2164 domain-containing protein [Vallitalea okinawensis]
MLQLTKEQKDKLMEDIIQFFDEERDEEIGIIAASTVLDFFLEELGDKIYNKGLDDAKTWFSHQMENMESDFYSLYK